MDNLHFASLHNIHTIIAKSLTRNYLFLFQLFLSILVLLTVINYTVNADQRLTNHRRRFIKSNLNRVKRAGSFDFVGHIKSGIVSGITRASASVAAGSSGSSSSGSSGSNEHKGYHYPEPEHVRQFS